MNPWEVALRIGVAVLLGTVIGIERERKNRPAGMRTHVLVCLGACIVALIECELKAEAALTGGGAVNYTMGRISAQVVSGIGFLGAGTIFTARKKIAGLTTAASLWTMACLGIAVGFGYYWIAGLGCLIVIVVLALLQRILHVNTYKKVEVKFIHRLETLEYINGYMERHLIVPVDIDFHVENQEPNNIYTNIYELRMPPGVSYIDIVQHLSEYKNIQSVRTMNT